MVTEDDERRVYVCFCFYKTLDVLGLTNTYILIKIYIYKVGSSKEVHSRCLLVQRKQWKH